MDLKDCETAIDFARNASRLGLSRTCARSPQSAYMLVGGTRDIYSVTINHETGHFCQVAGTNAVCLGNLWGKGRRYGSIRTRNPYDRSHWCKHVVAALGDAEKLVEAAEISARAFGDQHFEEVSQRLLRAQDRNLRRKIAELVRENGLEQVKAVLRAA